MMTLILMVFPLPYIERLNKTHIDTNEITNRGTVHDDPALKYNVRRGPGALADYGGTFQGMARSL
jgi:hypothetical protein